MVNSLLDEYSALARASLSEAIALPFGVYHDLAVFQREAKDVFHNDWVFVCAEQQISNVGDYFAFDLAGEALALVRGQDGKVRALSNICRHRGTPLLDEGFGQIQRNIVCPYHAWAYDDQGKLKGVPLAGDIEVDKSAHCLPEFHLTSWLGLLFVNLSQQPQDFNARLKGLDEYLEVYQPERFNQGYIGATEHWQANWKLAVENGIESYHLFKVHKDTLEQITPSKQAFYVAGSSEWTITAGKYLDKRSKLTKWLTQSSDHHVAFDHYALVFLPPSFIGIMSADSFTWLQILPDGAEHCVVRSGGISEYSGKESHAEAEFTEAFLEEDKHIVERVQKGMHSQKGRGGKLVAMEQIVVDFRQYLGSRLFGTTPEPFRQNDEALAIFMK